MISNEEITSTSGEVICHATETLHSFCGHIITDFKHHSPVCISKQNLSRPSTRSGRSRSSTLTSIASSIVEVSTERVQSRPGTAQSKRSEDGTFTRLSRAVSLKASSVFRNNSLRSLAGSITGRRETPDDPAYTFSFSARVSCPQLLIQPLHSPFPCPPCADIWGVGPRGTGKEGTEREMTAEEEIELENKMFRLKPMMQEWAAKMNAWDCGERALKKGGKLMMEDSER
ncbi:hypothetical protein MFRU_009g00470 [Monilinia fructicola]|uniref:Uncharacterized protein n=1 Tax=Monilinia fructicola TaxID=38448 RepID=A0A5M9K2S7_MONFR|nr:hypothetical protein EYC84_006256 [Monilinia fructicola]KAG4031256.1 hypothetical protein MFRU_009g00470 [Monilinia fructicola]